MARGIDTGVGLVNVCTIPCCSVATHQGCAVAKQRVKDRYFRYVQSTTHIDGSELSALVENILHINDIRSIPSRQGEGGEVGAAIEQVVHDYYFASVPTCQVESSNSGTVLEHALHFGERVGVPGVGAREGKEMGAVIEHALHAVDFGSIPSI